MRARRRWAAGITIAGMAGTSVLLGTTGTAAAADNRYALTAQGDSMFFQLDGEDIPASPTNEAGSLTAEAENNSTGNSTAFAGAPYWGKTAQTLPGTINGVPNQFGAPQLQLPMSQFPGYVTSSYPSVPKAEDARGHWRVQAESDETHSTAAGSNGAPEAVPAPNQQQFAKAEARKLADGSTLTAAEGSAAGFVQGPLELGNSVAKAQITDHGGAPKLESSVFGRFSIAGQDFGFDKSGFTYLGQSTDKKAALDAANAALKAANIRIDLAPETTQTDAVSGALTYILGGLKVTTTQTSPSGAVYTIGYILGRVKVSSVDVAPTAAIASSNVTKSVTTLGGVSGSPNSGTPAAARSSDGTGTPATAVSVPATSAVRGAGTSSPVPLARHVLAARAKPTATSDEGLYLVLALAGLGILVLAPWFGPVRAVLRSPRG